MTAQKPQPKMQWGETLDPNGLASMRLVSMVVVNMRRAIILQMVANSEYDQWEECSEWQSFWTIILGSTLTTITVLKNIHRLQLLAILIFY